MKNICLVDFDMTVTGGVEQVTASLANSLCEEFTVFVYAINSNYGDVKYKLDERVRYTFGLKDASRLRHMIQGVFREFREFVKGNKIDTVILMGNYPAFIMSFMKIGIKAKYIYCDHGALMNQWHQKDITLMRFFNTFCSDKVIVLTTRTKNDYIKKFRVSPRKIDCIYNWIEDGYHNKYGYKSDSKSIISVGRIAREKGFDMLVDVAEKVLPNHPAWTWDVYGDGPDKKEIENRIKEKGLGNQLFLKGNVNNLKELYQEYAFLVLSSYREGLPLVLLEATASRLPMISFDVMTGPNEIIHDGIDGLLIPPYNIGAMAEGINTLISNDEMRKDLSKSTVQSLDKFSKQKILNQWISLIKEN